MKIVVVGTGYVGLVVGTCLADLGNFVSCIDSDEGKIDRLRSGRIPIYEPGLSELVVRNVVEQRLLFTTGLEDALTSAEVIYIAVGTPPLPDGTADLSAVRAVAAVIGAHLPQHSCVVIIKSTVPVGTNDLVRSIIEHACGDANRFDMVSNPEFLKEGCAIDDFMKPDRIIIGAQSQRAREVMEYLYAPLVRTENPILFMDIRSAEMAKYAANAFLATKISFINEIANICERVGADVNQVRRGVGSDSRIGHRFLFPGVGYGGSCFPKDVKALSQLAKSVDYETFILDAVDRVNTAQKSLLGRKIKTYFGSNLCGKTIAIWGLSFKPQTDDIREAPSLVLIEQLLSAGANVRAFDPVAMDEARKILGESIVFAKSSYDAASGADAVALVTEWNEFRRPNFALLAEIMRSRVIFDGRNILARKNAQDAGFEYVGVGYR